MTGVHGRSEKNGRNGKSRQAVEKRIQERAHSPQFAAGLVNDENRGALRIENSQQVDAGSFK